MKKHMIIGGIIKHNNSGYGFKLSFGTAEEAQHYKEMIFFIIKNDKYDVNLEHGYHDKKE